jgi:hypothetical protein
LIPKEIMALAEMKKAPMTGAESGTLTSSRILQNWKKSRLI